MDANKPNEDHLGKKEGWRKSTPDITQRAMDLHANKINNLNYSELLASAADQKYSFKGQMNVFDVKQSNFG